MLDLLLAHRLLPDALLRACIRHRLAGRLRRKAALTEAEHREQVGRFAEALRAEPIDPGLPEALVSPAFHRLCLGPRLKQSCCWFERGTEPLAAAEDAMLRLVAIRARLEDGQAVLDLGAGWGSLSLWMATRYPTSRITALCRAPAQRDHIDAEARRLGLANLSVAVADLNTYDTPAGAFDRVLSIELFERLKNWPRLLAALARWLRPNGLLFLQTAAHQRLAYHLAPAATADWLGRRFLPGAMIPSDDLLARIQDDLRIVQHWRIDGRHYQQTAERWLANLDGHRAAALAELATSHGAAAAPLALANWRLFCLICAERWGFRQGSEWIVSHHLLQPASKPS